METPCIRPATLNDVKALAKLYVDSVHTHFKGTLPDEELYMWKYEPEERRMTEQIQKQNMHIMLLEDAAGQLVGFIRVGPDEDRPELGCLESIFVRDEYHGHGYGKLLFQKAQ